MEISDSLIKTLTVEKAKITQVQGELKLTGKIVADQSKQIDVYPLAGGIVKNISVELGDFVEKDQTLAIIKSGEAADYEKLFIDAKSNYEVAKKNAAVSEDLFNSKLISEREYLTAKQDFKKAEGELNKAKNIQSIYNLSNQSDYVIKAPISGFVINKNINKDMQIRTDNGESLFTIAQLNDIWVLANVYETDIEKVKEKEVVQVTTIAYPEKVYNAVIDKVYNVLDAQSRVMKVRVKLHNPDYLLKPEMYSNVLVKYQENERMMTIPSAGIVFDNSNNYVVICDTNKKLRVQKIDLYKVIGDQAYIKSGVKENERIITSNQLLIYNALTNN